MAKRDDGERAHALRVNPLKNGKLEVTLVMTGVNSPHVPSALETIAPQLFNLEPHAESEKTLNLDVNLYQMEKELNTKNHRQIKPLAS